MVFLALAGGFQFALGLLLVLRLFGSLHLVASRPGGALLGASICALTCLQLEPDSPWPRVSLPWFPNYFRLFPQEISWLVVVQCLSLGGLYFGVWHSFLACCRCLAGPFAREARFRLFSCLFMLSAFLWLQAAFDWAHFKSALDLRLEACRQIQQGRPELAASLLERAFVVDPGQLDIAGDLAELYRELGREAEAMSVLNRAVSLCPRRPRQLASVYAQRGYFLLRAGRLRGARQDLRMALLWAPYNQELRAWLRLADGSGS